jgi:hypothetical protein
MLTANTFPPSTSVTPADGTTGPWHIVSAPPP